jgi:hypothetical protein
MPHHRRVKKLIAGNTPDVEFWTATKRLAASASDPAFMRRLHAWMTVFWIAMIPVSYALGWLKSVVYVSALSLWAGGWPLVDLAGRPG